ncbi:MAG: hypothetical protein V5A25_02530 [Halovenus sp.]
MVRWQERVDDLLYEGETVEETVDFEGFRLVVTSHRVLAFTPETEGENFQQVDRPNVTRVTTGAGRDEAMLRRSVALGAFGAVSVAIGALVDFDSLVGDVDVRSDAAGQLGIGGVLDTIQWLFDLLSRLDEFLLVFGSIATIVAVALLAVYWFLREPALVVETVGDDGTIRVPQPTGDADARVRLERAIFPDRTGIPDESRSSRDRL